MSACSVSSDPTVPATSCANVVAADVVRTGTSYQVSVTVASADTGWDKYADRWVVRTLNGSVLRKRELAHPHVNEQPFTRVVTGVTIPDDVDVVEFAARDSVEGFCGKTIVLDVPRG